MKTLEQIQSLVLTEILDLEERILSEKDSLDNNALEKRDIEESEAYILQTQNHINFLKGLIE